jgi:hypothetical protein
MTESAPATDTIDPTDTTEQVIHRNTRLYQVLAWVGIVAGILFIVAVVFFSGFLAARAAGGYGWHRGYQSGQMRPDGPMGGGCPMMQMEGGTGPGGMGPGGMGPGGMGPGGARASTPPSTMPMPVPMPTTGQR